MAVRHLLFVLAAVMATSAGAQERLFAEGQLIGDAAEYQSTIRQVLREAFSNDVELSALVQQSFDVEFAVGLRRSRGSYEIFSVQPSRQIFSYTFLKFMKQRLARTVSPDDRRQVEVEIATREASLPARPSDLPLTRCSAKIDLTVASALVRTWKMMLEEVQTKEQLSGLDGTTYQFGMTIEGRRLAGEVWSPAPESRSGQLARVAELMRNYCVSKQPNDLRELLSMSNALLQGT